MKTVTLSINNDLERLLRQFLHTDHRGTHNPIYLVQTMDTDIVFDGGDTGDNKCYSQDNDEVYDTPEELVEATTPLDKKLVKPFYDLRYGVFNGVTIIDLTDYFRAYDVGAEIVSEVTSYRTVAYFFTEEEAKRYIQYQSHNLTKPRTFDASPGYANEGDWDPFYQLLLEIAQKCVDPAEDLPQRDAKTMDVLDILLRKQTAAKANGRESPDRTLGEMRSAFEKLFKELEEARLSEVPPKINKTVDQ